MANANQELFDSSEVKKHMKKLEGLFSDYAKILADLNNYVQENINVNPDSGIFGKRGARLLKSWDYNASTFGDFHKNFSDWSKAVAVISANYEDFAYSTKKLYKNNNAGTAEGVQDKRQSLKDAYNKAQSTADGTLENTEEVVSQVNNGDAISWQTGMEVNIGGEKYYYYGSKIGDKVSGKRAMDHYFVKEDPNAKGFDINTANVYCCNDGSTISKETIGGSKDDYYTNTLDVNRGFTVTKNIETTNHDKKWAATEDYIKKTSIEVKTDDDFDKAMNKDGYQNFYIADDKKVVETDKSNVETNSNLYYTRDGNSVYYIDHNNDGVVTCYDGWDESRGGTASDWWWAENTTSEAATKVHDDGNDSGYIFEIQDIDE